MRTTLFSLFAILCTIPTAVVADVNPLTCSVTLQDTVRVLKPRSEFGRAFSTFTLDLSKDPKGWEHQNRCVSAKDFRGASFAGFLCLVVISGAGSEDPSAPVFLSVQITRDAVEMNDQRASSYPAGSRSRGASSLLVPINTSGERVELRHTFATKGGKGELFDALILCGR